MTLKTFMWTHVAAVVVTLTGGLLLAGCDVPNPPKYRYAVGEVARLKIDGEKVQVISRWRIGRGSVNVYQCRVGGLHQSRRDGLVSADTEIVRYRKVIFREYELIPDEEEKP